MDDANHFERLGLPRRFALDERELERQYLARSRALHPDFHQAGSSGEQNASMQLTAKLNEAYGVLRDSFKRAEYLLTLEGGPTASEQKEMPAEFLDEVLEIRMEMADLDDSNRAAMETRLKTRRDAMLKEVGAEFARLETDANRSAMLKSLRQRINALKYIQNLLRDI